VGWFIKAENGISIGEPFFLEETLDIHDDPPHNYVSYLKIDPPVATKHQKLVLELKQIDGQWQDAWIIEDMTDEEKQNFYNEEKQKRLEYIQHQIETVNDSIGELLWRECLVLTETCESEFPDFPIQQPNGSWTV
jgi:hypothetical protein